VFHSKIQDSPHLQSASNLATKAEKRSKQEKVGKSLLCLLLGLGIVCFGNAGALAVSSSSPDINAYVAGGATPNHADGILKIAPAQVSKPGPGTILVMGLAFLCLAGVGRKLAR
jgi:hypothetical protein